MRIAGNPVHGLLVVTALFALGTGRSQAQDFSPAQVARVVAENSEALRAYSWSLRVEATIGGEERAGLYKVRYDFDGELETRGTEVEFPAEQRLVFTLSAPTEIGGR